MATEAYRQGKYAAIIHERRGGFVYGHVQEIWGHTVYLTDLFKMAEEDFSRAVTGAESYDVRRLPALQPSDAATT